MFNFFHHVFCSKKRLFCLHQGDDEEDYLGGSPPDSPQPITPMPQFTGELDQALERFGVTSCEGCSLACNRTKEIF